MESFARTAGENGDVAYGNVESKELLDVREVYNERVIGGPCGSARDC